MCVYYINISDIYLDHFNNLFKMMEANIQAKALK